MAHNVGLPVTPAKKPKDDKKPEGKDKQPEE